MMRMKIDLKHTAFVNSKKREFIRVARVFDWEVEGKLQITCKLQVTYFYGTKIS